MVHLIKWVYITILKFTLVQFRVGEGGHLVIHLTVNALLAGFGRAMPRESGYQAADSWTHLTLSCPHTVPAPSPCARLLEPDVLCHSRCQQHMEEGRRKWWSKNRKGEWTDLMLKCCNMSVVRLCPHILLIKKTVLKKGSGVFQQQLNLAFIGFVQRISALPPLLM